MTVDVNFRVDLIPDRIVRFITFFVDYMLIYFDCDKSIPRLLAIFAKEYFLT